MLYYAPWLPSIASNTAAMQPQGPAEPAAEPPAEEEDEEGGEGLLQGTPAPARARRLTARTRARAGRGRQRARNVPPAAAAAMAVGGARVCGPPPRQGSLRGAINFGLRERLGGGVGGWGGT